MGSCIKVQVINVTRGGVIAKVLLSANASDYNVPRVFFFFPGRSAGPRWPLDASFEVINNFA